MWKINRSENLYSKGILNTQVFANYAALQWRIFLLPIFLLVVVVLFLFSQNALTVERYTQFQENYFLFLNSHLSQYPSTLFNLTQLGDTMVALSFLSILIIYTPKVWESMISALIVSAIFSNILKNLFAVPRPAAVLDPHSFVIIGRTLKGHSSLPSGHSITIFTILTVLMYSFMPKKKVYKVLWIFFILSIGLIFSFTRVGVGAHYPMDVIIGSIIGYISGLLGIFINKKYKIWDWINQTKYYPIFILLFLVFGVILVVKIDKENLLVYYMALVGLVVSLYKIINIYVQK